MSQSWRYLLAFGVVTALVLYSLTGIGGSLKQGMQSLSLPIVSRLTSLTRNVVSDEQRDERIKELEQRLSAQTVDYVKMRAYEEENRALRAQARFLQRSGYDSVGARVIRRELSGQRAVFLIDRGKDDALELGQAVITDNGMFIGKITQLYSKVAEVTLITDGQSRVATALQGEGRLTGVLEGKGNGAMELTYIPSTASIKADQLVITAGTEDKIPGNLPIGYSSVIHGKASDPFFSASIESLVRFDEITLVSILRPSALAPSL